MKVVPKRRELIKLDIMYTGKVVQVGSNTVDGNFVKIVDASGRIHHYNNLSESLVKGGDFVSKGEVIGLYKSDINPVVDERSEKTKVTKAVGIILDKYKLTMYEEKVELAERHAKRALTDSDKVILYNMNDDKVLYELNPLELSIALVNGYETLINPLEEIKLLYNNAFESRAWYFERNDIEVTCYFEARMKVIKEINELLGLGIDFEEVE